MKEDPRQARASSSRRIYETLLSAYPRRFRERHGREMADIFEDDCLELMTRRGSRAGLLVAWVWALIDLAHGVLAERSGSMIRSVVPSNGLVSWGGVAAAVGGFLIASGGLAFSTVGNGGYNTSINLAFLLSLISGIGTLLVFGGLAGLVRLIERHGVLSIPNTRASVTSVQNRSQGLSWTQRSAVWGLILGTATALVAVAGLAWFIVSGGTMGGAAWGAWGKVVDVLFIVLALFRQLGLPLAMALLGIAVWRSGVFGRWRSLPLFVALLASPLPVFTVALIIFPAGEVLSREGVTSPLTTIDHWLIFGLPAMLTGLGWMLFGFVLVRKAKELPIGNTPRRSSTG